MSSPNGPAPELVPTAPYAYGGGSGQSTVGAAPGGFAGNAGNAGNVAATAATAGSAPGGGGAGGFYTGQEPPADTPHFVTPAK